MSHLRPHKIILPMQEVERLMELGRRRNDHNIDMGKAHRHPGRPGGISHGLGLMGEAGFKEYLNKRGIAFLSAPDWEDDPKKWRQDFTISDLTYGVKTCHAICQDKILGIIYLTHTFFLTKTHKPFILYSL